LEGLGDILKAWKDSWRFAEQNGQLGETVLIYFFSSATITQD
jgi:hypothetical protein